MRTEQRPRARREAPLTELARTCYVGDVEDAAHRVVRRARERGGGYVCHCNVHTITLATRDDAVRTALAGAWTRFPDGAPVAWLQRRLGLPATRVGGPDLMPRVFDLGREANLRHALFGSTETVLGSLHRRLQDTFPGCAIVAAVAPPFDADLDAPSVLEPVCTAEPDVIWCALGAPKQELWMARHAHALEPALVLGVGAAFDFLAGTKPRAPSWMQRAGLEWMHRLASEPSRLGRRYVTTNSEFIVRTGLELLRAHGQS